MKEFECTDLQIQTGGGVVDAFISAFGPYKARGEKVICRHLGIERVDPRPESFYVLAKFLGAMAELQDQFGPSFMRKIGAFIFEKAVFPPGIDSAPKGMAVINQAYYMNHLNAAEGKIGRYHWTAIGDGVGTMICDNPYPCAFDIGILETIGRRFAPGTTVRHEPAAPCRHAGGEQCTYEVRF